jgi:hypothetical protein
MHKNDKVAPDCLPTASGIEMCLRMLTEEALALNLRRSVLALRAAALVVEAEAGDLDLMSPFGLRFGATANVQAR